MNKIKKFLHTYLYKKLFSIILDKKHNKNIYKCSKSKMSACSDQRSVYLITYSRADLDKVKTREEFAEIWVQAFGKDLIKQWACSCEKHKEDDAVHYHLALKLKRVKRWKLARENVIRQHGIVCNFQEFHTNYYDAYGYVKKEDVDYVTSEGHPMLANSPQTKKASAKRVSIQSAADLRVRQPQAKQPKVKLDTITVYDIIVTNNLHNERDLFVLAHNQKEEGKTDLLEYILKMSDKRRAELIRTAWRVENSTKENARLKLSNMEILQKAKTSECICGGEYYIHATETLRENGIDVDEFKSAVVNALKYGRKKGNNVMIIGPANCGKTFILKPLTEIFKCFVSPASGTFAWVGAENAEVVFLNDLRWNDKLMAWSDFLNLLEGLPVHLPAPKTHFAEDILWTQKTPILATSSTRIRKYDGGVLNDVETGMVETRWRYFEFYKPVDNPKEIKSCPCCFANIMLS